MPGKPKRFCLRRAAAALGLAAAAIQGFMPAAALASVSTQMDVMWNTTAARAYGTTMSTGVYGGNFSLRSPINTFTLISFDPPHFDAGCGGVDMYLGSFSFLSAQQFSQMIRMIIQNAAGYLVHLAIKAICDPCENIMGKLEQIMQQLNAGQINTCKISKTMVDTAVKASGLEDIGSFMGPVNSEVNQNALTIAGNKSDWMSSLTQAFSNGDDSVTQSQQNASTAYGNIVVNAIMTTGALSAFSNPYIFGGDLGTIEMVINLFGTSVIETTPAPGTSSAGPGSNLPTPQFAPTLKFMDLVLGPDNTPHPIYTCADWTAGSPLTCQHLQRSADYAALNFPGTLRYVVQELAGDQSYSPTLASDPNADRNINVIMPGSILANMQAGQKLSPPQVAFLQSLPVSYQDLLLDAYEASPTTSIYDQIAQLMSEDLAASLGEGMLTVLKTAFVPGSMTNQANGKANSPIPQDVEAARREFAKDLVSYEGENEHDRLARIQQIVGAIAIETNATGRTRGSAK